MTPAASSQSSPLSSGPPHRAPTARRGTSATKPGTSRRPSSRLSAFAQGVEFYILAVLILAVAPFPLQCGRHWRSPIFEAPSWLNRDAAEWLSMADTRPFLSKAAPMRLGRPLYPWTAYMIRHVFARGESTVSIYRGINIFWFLVAAVALRWWTLYWTRDSWAALAAGALFAASPFVQIYLWQPMPEILAATVSVGVLCLAALTAGWRAREVRAPTRWESLDRRKRWKPWVVVGASTAVLMLGKEFYSLYLCLLLIGLVRRAWKPILAFAAAAAAVHLTYIAWVKWGIGRSYSPYGHNAHGFITWVFQDLLHRPFKEELSYLGRLAGRIGFRTAQAFWFYPLGAAVVGAFALRVKPRIVDLLVYLASWYILFLATNIVTPRIAYQCFFPSILPAAGAGVVAVVRWSQSRFGGAGRIGWRIALALALLSGILLDPFWFFYYG